MTKRVLILGSTGSVGRQSLDVLRRLSDSHQIVGLSAARSSALLSEQAHEFRPSAVCLAEAEQVAAPELPAQCRLLTGAAGLVQLVEATAPDLVVCAITGAAGLPSTLAAARSGATLALANKESLVLAGPLVKAACRASGSRIVPVDSEHSAIAQCLAGHPAAGVRRLILTASGGPFRGRRRAELLTVTPQQALRHPSWVMGPRITIDSATLMNKALEIVEACQLFDVPAEQVSVIVHPQSIIHSMVEFIDGALLAQLSRPDMRLPIRYALGAPGRIESGDGQVDLLSLSGLSFEEPDRETFRCLALGEEVARLGGTAGCVMNAANEIAVHAFLEQRLSFLGIAELVEAALTRFEHRPAADLTELLELDQRVRTWALTRVASPAKSPRAASSQP
ncbi:MAG: 1-deoxy-D-xylulose-5-phosphate reductoisomerase [Planctomycetota bacterium]